MTYSTQANIKINGIDLDSVEVETLRVAIAMFYIYCRENPAWSFSQEWAGKQDAFVQGCQSIHEKWHRK